MNKIINFYNHLECPIVDGIIFPDESIHLLKVETNNLTHCDINILKLDITNIEKLNPEWCNNCAILCNVISKEHEIEILSGEGSYGSDGFIAVLNCSTKKLIWLAYFMESNPFCKIEIKINDIFVTSTLDFVWKFNILDPTDIKVQALFYPDSRSF